MQGLVWWGLVLALWGNHKALATSQSNEHKVPYIQNIMLYPDKHSWCKTTEIKQIVAYPGCTSVEIDNSVCVGACFSYSIPKTSPSAPGEVITPYCDSCQPSNYTWKEVKLTCKGESGEDDEEVIELVKKVQVITNCTCSSCEQQPPSTQNTEQQRKNNETEVPELMCLMLQHSNVKNCNVGGSQAEESAQISVEKTNPQDLENAIDVDEEKDKEESKEIEEDDSLELLQVNHEPNQELHLVPGPHHSLVLKPDNVQQYHGQDLQVKHHKSNDDEQVPSLLENQFKVHDDEEFPDQLAVESRKEFDGKPPEVITVPELIYKWNFSKPEQTELKTDDQVIEQYVETKDFTQKKHHEHHKQHHDENERQDENISVNHHHGRHHLPHNVEEDHKGVKIVEVSHHHLKPAMEGAQITYEVKSEDVKVEE